MSDIQTKKPMFRPTEAQRFPYCPLSKAIEHAKVFYRIAGEHEVAAVAAVKAWGFGEKSSSGVQTLAALKAFGLLQDSGSGATRKLKLTEDAIKIIRDPREISPERDSLIRDAALRPALHRDILSHFGDRGPESDEALKTYLIFDVHLRDRAVNDCMAEFAATMAFAKVSSSTTIPSGNRANSGNEPRQAANVTSEKPVAQAPTQESPADHEPTVKVGDYVQWTSAGVDQFKPTRRVVWVSEDGTHLRVTGSMGGVPVAEVTVTDPPAPAPSVVLPSTSGAYAGTDGDLNVLLTGNRLQITAEVDLAGLARLKEVLGHYENILKLLTPVAPTH